MVWAVREGTRYEYRMVLWRHDMAREDRPPENNSLTDRQICTGKLFKTIIERSQDEDEGVVVRPSQVYHPQRT